ncbi:unnamed protein product, partial [Prorocentrum cordatum]
ASMASVEALASAQAGADWRRRNSASSDDAALHAATVDLKDGFHQFKSPHLSEWFALDVPGVRAMDLGAQQVYGGDAGSCVEAAPDDYAWPACSGPSMGWSWALWICHESLAHATRSSADPHDAAVLDKAPAVRLERDMAGGFPRADNAGIIGVERDLVRARLERMTAALDLLGLKWHEAGRGRRGGDPGRLRPKQKRLWRLGGGLTFLLKWRKAAGWQIPAVLGHLVSFFQLLTPGPSVFRAPCDFARQYLGEMRGLPTAALHVQRVARSFLFMSAGRWWPPPCPVALMTGASTKGRALQETDATPDE